MPRTAGDAAIQTKEARSKKKRGVRHWRGISNGVAIGYRKGTTTGAWYSRIRDDAGIYHVESIAEADDKQPANGADVLDYTQAVERVLAAVKRAKLDRGVVRTPITVAVAVERYVAQQRAAKGDDPANDSLLRLNRHVIPTLGNRRVSELTLTQLQAWRDDLVTREESPVSRGTANRIMKSLGAALNFVFRDDRNDIPSNKAWTALQPFPDVTHARPDHFGVEEAQRLIDAARRFDPPFADLIAGGFLTSARYGELCALDVKHFDAKRGVLMIPSGKTGPRVVTLIVDAIAFFDRITKGRAGNRPLFQKADGERWRSSDQYRRMKQAIDDPKVGLPKSVVFYALRHSHISRAIESDVPLYIIARNCGTSEQMIRTHYAKLLTEREREMLERGAGAFRLRVVPDEPDRKVVQLGSAS